MANAALPVEGARVGPALPDKFEPALGPETKADLPLHFVAAPTAIVQLERFAQRTEAMDSTDAGAARPE